MSRKGKKRFAGSFLLMPHAVLHSPAFRGLSPKAVKLLIDLGSQYNGKNNGDLCMAWKVMNPRGWKSEETLHTAKRELLETGFIAETRKGRRPNLCSLYGITWQPLNPSEKLDISPSGFPYGAWDKGRLPRLVTRTAA